VNGPRPSLAGINLGVITGLAQQFLESPDFAGLVGRVLRAAGRRVGCGDLPGLAALAELSAEVDTALTCAVRGLRRGGHSWEDIADALPADTITPQTAQDRWGSNPTTGGGAV
jgi:hypothetical protein